MPTTPFPLWLQRLSCGALAALVLAAPALGQGNQAADEDDDDEPPQQPAEPARPQRLPAQELSGAALYEFLLGEIALQRGDTEVAARTYLDLARRTRDPRVAQRAVQIASQARAQDLALEGARLWSEIDPGSLQALQTVTALLIAARRVGDAEPYLARLLAADGINVETGFLQLGRLLASNPDKAANLRVVQRLAAKYPKMPQARLAISQAALAAGDDALALKEARQASTLRPEWEPAVVMEAQVLQKRSNSEAAKRLAAHLEKYPLAREVRLNYARVLVADKRLPEAREQFDKLLAANPGNTELTYAVGLLAFQLKDYQTAESSMKRLLDTGYRDPNGARYLLGQIAEEQKRLPEALDWYRQIQRGEHAMPARLRTASVMAKQGKLPEARAFLRAIDASGREQQVQLIVAEAQLLRDANQHREAFDFLDGELKKDPGQPELLYDIALTAEKLDRFDVLEVNLRELIKVRPDHAHAYNALGYSLAERNQRLPEAKKLIEKALELAPADFFIIDSMGWVLYRQGDLKGAVNYLRRAWAGRPDAEIGAHLGEVLWVSGQRDEARRIWQESVRTNPDNETLQKTIQRFKP